MAVPRVSVILSTYNQPTALRYVLRGYRRQIFSDFEIVIADDGSSEETLRVIEEFRASSPFAIGHVRQENKGYRRSRIANEAVLHSRGSLLVLSDGDCIPHRDFLRLHAESCPENGFSVGGYVGLSREQTLTVNGEFVDRGGHEGFLTLGRRFSDRLQHLWNHLSYAVGKEGRPKIRGCNIGVSRRVYVGINGYDENFDGFGKEDSDLRNRLMMAAARPVSLWGRSYVFHLHTVIDETFLGTRIPRRKDLAQAYYRRSDVKARCENGLVREGERIDGPCPRCGRPRPGAT